MNVGEFSTWVVFLAKPNYDQESILGNWYSGLTRIRPGLIHLTLSGFPTNSRDLGCVMKLEYASTLGGLCGGMAHTLVGHGQTSISAEIGS